jgi:hypothetical protein
MGGAGAVGVCARKKGRMRMIWAVWEEPLPPPEANWRWAAGVEKEEP